MVVYNIWTFVAVALLLVFSFERNRFCYDDIPMFVREVLVAPCIGDVTGLMLLVFSVVGIGIIYSIHVIWSYVYHGVVWTTHSIMATVTAVFVGSAHLSRYNASEFIPVDRGLVVIGLALIVVVGLGMIALFFSIPVDLFALSGGF
jgi:hypothetical protein